MFEVLRLKWHRGRGSRTIPEAPFGRALERVLSVRREGLHRASCRVLRPDALGRRWPQAPLLGAPLDTNFATPQRGATAHVSSVIWGTASVAAREKVTESYEEHDSAHSHYSVRRYKTFAILAVLRMVVPVVAVPV